MFQEAEKNKLLVGYKQTMKAIKSEKVQKVIIAKDCDEMLLEKIKACALEFGCEILYTESMQELGKLCGIELKTSCASVLK